MSLFSQLEEEQHQTQMIKSNILKVIIMTHEKDE